MVAGLLTPLQVAACVLPVVLLAGDVVSETPFGVAVGVKVGVTVGPVTVKVPEYASGMLKLPAA